MAKTVLIMFIFTFSISSLAFNEGEFKLEPMHLTEASSSKEKDKRLVVFWATWCGTCKGKLKEDLPALNQNPNIEVVTVNIDEDRRRAEHYIKKEHLEIPVWADPYKELQKSLNVVSVPHWAVYERKENEWILKTHQEAYHKSEVNKALGI